MVIDFAQTICKFILQEYYVKTLFYIPYYNGLSSDHNMQIFTNFMNGLKTHENLCWAVYKV